jgi:hypothetical protein
LSGHLNADEKEGYELFKEVNTSFETWEGLISRTVFWDKENGVATGIYLCESKESALKARDYAREMLERYNDLAGFTTELFGEVVGYNTVK